MCLFVNRYVGWINAENHHYIHKILLELRKQGKAILLISAELTDIFQLSDRIAVLYKGEVMALKKNEEFTKESIGLLMAGQKGGE